MDYKVSLSTRDLAKLLNISQSKVRRLLAINDSLVTHLRLTCDSPVLNGKVLTLCITDDCKNDVTHLRLSSDSLVTHLEEKEEKKKASPDDSNLNLSKEKDKEKEEKNIMSNSSTMHLEEKEEFERFRKQYGGSKNGFEKEFKNFKTKHPKDWFEIVPLLQPGYDRYMEYLKKVRLYKGFDQQICMFAKFINQEYWNIDWGEVRESRSSYGVVLHDNSTDKYHKGRKGW